MSRPADLYREFEQRGGLVDLSDRVKLRLSGPDRVRYLNGQVTSNVLRLTDGEGQPSCVVTAKGKLCADVWISARADALFIDADVSLRDSLPARLGRYIIADAVELEEVTDQWRVVHLMGILPADAWLEEMAASRARRFGIDGCDLFLSPESFEKIWQAIAATRPVLDASLLDTIRIERGIPRWGFELTETTLPPEAGLDRTHVDYQKGCYVGQEVISRLKSVGHVNRRLVGLLATESALAPAAGMKLFAAVDREKPIGDVTSATWSFALDRPVALGYLKRGAAMHDLVARASEARNADVPVTAQELPFVP
jgi:folate-binding protein YgfZ